MGIHMAGNYIFTRPGEKAFLVSSNWANYMELGRKGVTDYYLEAKIEKDEFLVSGIIYDAKGVHLCNLKDNHLENIKGDCIFQPVQNRGYQIIDKGNVIFGLLMKDLNTCVLQGAFYDSRGNLIAEGDKNDFRVYKGPAVLGKSGESRGIVLDG